jgi:hypothetical protein
MKSALSRGSCRTDPSRLGRWSWFQFLGAPRCASKERPTRCLPSGHLLGRPPTLESRTSSSYAGARERLTPRSARELRKSVTATTSRNSPANRRPAVRRLLSSSASWASRTASSGGCSPSVTGRKRSQGCSHASSGWWPTTARSPSPKPCKRRCVEVGATCSASPSTSTTAGSSGSVA